MIAETLDPVVLTERLIACDSVTPATGTVFAELAAMLAPLGFAVERFVAGEAPDGPVENLIAVRNGPVGGRHFAFAGHLDVVPPGQGWASAPFAPERRGDLLYGRGAVDMKGAIAAMVAAVAQIPADAGTISFLITGDEEGPARYGTVEIIRALRETGQLPNLCLVGEPTSTRRLGDMAKIGRRGSVNIWLTAPDAQGHVAYPHLADNPIPRLVALLSELDAWHLDAGSEWFQPSNLEVTDITVGNPATNVIPAEARAAVDPVQRSANRGRSGGASHRDGRAPPRGHPRGDFGRGVPDPARRVFDAGCQRCAGRNRDCARSIHHRGHVGCAVPARGVPGDRIRTVQCDHAQDR